MTARTEGAGVAPTLDAGALAAAAPGLAARAGIIPVAFARKASSSLTPEDVVAVAALVRARLTAGEADAAVVVQGTDTIEETAFVLALLLAPQLRVAVTGAMRPPEAPGADGPANLLAAAAAALAPEAAGLGPLVVLNDQIHAAALARKASTTLPSAFASPGAGPLGVVAEGEAWFALRPAAAPPTLDRLLGLPEGTALDRLAAGGDWPAVALLRVGLGDDGRLLAAAPSLGFAGVVLEGAGAGHVPAAMAGTVGAVAAAMPVILASRAGAGPVFSRTYGYPGSEIDLLGRGAIGAGMLDGLKARLLLQLLLRLGAGPEAVRATFAAFARPGAAPGA